MEPRDRREGWLLANSSVAGFGAAAVLAAETSAAGVSPLVTAALAVALTAAVYVLLKTAYRRVVEGRTAHRSGGAHTGERTGR